jgi:predicted membrane protein
MTPLKLPHNVKYKLFFGGSIPFSIDFASTPMSSNHLCLFVPTKTRFTLLMMLVLMHLLVGLLFQLILALLGLILLTSLLMKKVKKNSMYEKERKGRVEVASKFPRYLSYKVSFGEINS